MAQCRKACIVREGGKNVPQKTRSDEGEAEEGESEGEAEEEQRLVEQKERESISQSIKLIKNQSQKQATNSGSSLDRPNKT